jgi:deoxyribonuclease-4
LRKERDVEKTLDQFDSVIGLKELKALHLNDSTSKIDRHEHIGLGKIGKVGFGALLQHKSLRILPMILETPVDKQRSDVDNLKAVQDLLR